MTHNISEAADFYTQVAVEFDASYARDANRRDRLQVWNALMTRYANGAELAYDLGCGSGAVTFELARYAKHIIGIDGATGMLAIARQHAASQNLADRVQFLESVLPMAGEPKLEQADVVVSSSAIEYMVSIPQTLTFVHKILRPGGKLIFSMPSQASWSRKFVRFAHRLTGRPDYLTYVRHFVTTQSLDADLKAAGFATFEHVYFAGADKLNRALGLFLPPRFAHNMIVTVAERLPSASPAN